MQRLLRTAVLALALFVAGVAPLLSAEKVVAYRNGGSGAYPDADPPLEWSVTKNVRWQWQPECPMFETTISTPIIVGDPSPPDGSAAAGRIFTLARPMSLICIDKNTGKELWRRERHIEDGEDVDTDVRRVREAIVRDCRMRSSARTCSSVPARVSPCLKAGGCTCAPASRCSVSKNLRGKKGRRKE
jgi:outer membrane protein assembly factor BamB